MVTVPPALWQTPWVVHFQVGPGEPWELQLMTEISSTGGNGCFGGWTVQCDTKILLQTMPSPGSTFKSPGITQLRDMSLWPAAFCWGQSSVCEQFPILSYRADKA